MCVSSCHSGFGRAYSLIFLDVSGVFQLSSPALGDEKMSMAVNFTCNRTCRLAQAHHSESSDSYYSGHAL
jgi:hypothetical protein